ncbi:MAG: hypothetical protein ACXAAO_10855 [Candidatus Thorarchaeota archaeon]
MSRQPYLLMLQDDSGEVRAIPLDTSMVNSDNALIVLDEYNDTCWVWIGRSVNMPTRMHALRMARGIQKSGHKVGVTTIGLASSRLVEMMEKDDTTQNVADAIAEFRSVIEGKWSFDDIVLAHKGEVKASEPIAGAPIKKTVTPEPEPTPTIIAETVTETPLTPAASASIAEKKMAYLMLSITRNSDLVYTERFEKAGKKGLKIESPGVMVIEAMFDGDFLQITPKDFGGSDVGAKIKTEFEGLVKRL